MCKEIPLRNKLLQNFFIFESINPWSNRKSLRVGLTKNYLLCLTGTRKLYLKIMPILMAEPADRSIGILPFLMSFFHSLQWPLTKH